MWVGAKPVSNIVCFDTNRSRSIRSRDVRAVKVKVKKVNEKQKNVETGTGE
jgi:hypothetical protein